MKFKKGLKKTLGLTITALSVIMLTSCSDIAAQSITGDGEMDEAAIRAIFDKMTNYEMTREEFMQLDQETRGRVYDILLEEMARNRPPLTEEQIEELRLQEEEMRRTDLWYIVNGDFTPASPDVDLQTIERFVFSYDIELGRGYSLVIDRMRGGVHFSLFNSRMFEHIDSSQFFSSFQEQDLERLIQAIEESNFRNWEAVHEGNPLPEMVMGSVPSWAIGILFSDGAIMRSSGGGDGALAFPPDGQFDILYNFIQTLGAEIAERHEAEAAESEATESDDEE